MSRPAWQLAPDYRLQVEEAARALDPHGIRPAERLGMVLGSGLGDFVDGVDARASVAFAEIPGFRGGHVKAHAGRLILGAAAGVEVLILQGRPHAYEGLSMGEVVFPVAVMAALGCRSLVLTNAAGGLRPTMQPGDLAVLEDLVDLHLTDVARGILEPAQAVPPGFFARAARAGKVFDPGLTAAIRDASAGIALHRAVYASLWGPNYEEPATVGWLRKIGADVVGMSTGPEAAYLHAVGVRVAGVSCITNVARQHAPVEVSHDEVVDVGGRSGARFSRLLMSALPGLAAGAPGGA